MTLLLFDSKLISLYRTEVRYNLRHITHRIFVNYLYSVHAFNS